MKILIFSDVHGRKDRLEGILKEHSDADYRLSLGDTELNNNYLKSRDIIGVKGNYPFDPGVGYDYTLKLKEFNLFLTHGHKYQIKFGLDTLYYKMLEEEARFCFHGHTHVIRFDDIEDRYIINPGAVNHPRGKEPASYLIMTINESIVFKWYDAINHTLLKEISV